MLLLPILVIADQYSRDVVWLKDFTPAFVPSVLAGVRPTKCFAGGDAVRGVATITATYAIPKSLAATTQDLVSEMTPDTDCRGAGSWTDAQLRLRGMDATKILADRVIRVHATAGRVVQWKAKGMTREERTDWDSYSTIELSERARISGTLPATWVAERHALPPAGFPGIDLSFLPKLPTRWTSGICQVGNSYVAVWYLHRQIGVVRHDVESELLRKGWREQEAPGMFAFREPEGEKSASFELTEVHDKPVELDKGWTEIRIGWSDPSNLNRRAPSRPGSQG